MTDRTCLVADCAKPSKTRGMCGMHAERVRAGRDVNDPGKIIIDPLTRFWSYVDKRGEDECWRWTGVHVPDGYGQFSVNYVRITAHRYAYQLLVGPIPDGAQIDHVKARGCTFRDCVNPAHLEAVTPYENLMRSDGPPAQNKRMKLCKWGHSFDIFFTGKNGRPRRACSICRRDQWRRANAKRPDRWRHRAA
jgi:hypothetical protein